MTQAKIIDVYVTHNGQAWVATIEGVAGGTSGPSLREVQEDIETGLPFLFQDLALTVEPRYHFDLPEFTTEDLEQFTELKRQKEALDKSYSATSERLVAALTSRGLTDSQVGDLLDLTKQRVQQIRTRAKNMAR